MNKKSRIFAKLSNNRKFKIKHPKKEEDQPNKKQDRSRNLSLPRV